MQREKYEQVRKLIRELYDAAVQESSSSVIPGESPRFRSALNELDGFSDDSLSFSKAALGEIRRTVAMVKAMRIPSLTPGSKVELDQSAF